MYRLFEVTAALVGLIVALPLMAVIAVLIKLDSAGPVLFRQTRVGRGGRDFLIYKFRTMTVHAGPPLGRFEPGNPQCVTRVGRVLRATKLDELPQLWHILTGHMALVGARPPLRRWVDACPERWARILTVRPGITHPAAILFRNEEKLLLSSADPERLYREEILPRKLDLYEQYLARRTWRTDLQVLLQTAGAVLFGRSRVAVLTREGEQRPAVEGQHG